MTTELSYRLRLPRTHHEGVSRRVVGAFFVSMGGVHLGIVAADAQTYDGFAQNALFGFVRSGWSNVFMATPMFWGTCLFLGETLLGALLLIGGRSARLGWVGVIGFHLLLMVFGLGIWLWSVPALLLLGYLARRDWPSLA